MGEVIRYRIAALARGLDALYKERAELQLRVKTIQSGEAGAPHLLTVQQEIATVMDETKLLKVFGIEGLFSINRPYFSSWSDPTS